MKKDLLQTALHEIIRSAEMKIETEYAHLPYHNLGHANLAAEEVVKLFDLEKQMRIEQKESFPLEKKDRELLILAAKSHDVIQGYSQFGENEERSAEWLTQKIKIYNEYFSPEEKTQLQIAILGTKTQLIEDQIVREITEIKKHQNPKTSLFAELLADSDLAALGMEWEIYYREMTALFQEMHPRTDFPTWENHLKQQSSLLRRFHYETQAARKKYCHLRENAEKIEALLENDEALEESFIKLQTRA